LLARNISDFVPYWKVFMNIISLSHTVDKVPYNPQFLMKLK